MYNRRIWGLKPHVIGAAISKRGNTTLQSEGAGGGAENIAVLRRLLWQGSINAVNTLWNM